VIAGVVIEEVGYEGPDEHRGQRGPDGNEGDEGDEGDGGELGLNFPGHHEGGVVP
jgi:hypothetical protein